MVVDRRSHHTALARKPRNGGVWADEAAQRRAGMVRTRVWGGSDGRRRSGSGARVTLAVRGNLSDIKGSQVVVIASLHWKATVTSPHPDGNACVPPPPPPLLLRGSVQG